MAVIWDKILRKYRWADAGEVPTHDRQHDMLSLADHAASSPENRGKLLGFNAETGYPEAVDKSTLGGGGIIIPQLQLDSGRYMVDGEDRQIVDQLRCWWQSNDTRFLNYNPEVWLFRYKKNRRKIRTGVNIGDKKFTKKWVHMPHLNGIKYPGSKYFAGNAYQSPEFFSYDTPVGYHSEFALTANVPLTKMVIPIEVFEFVYGLDELVNPYKLDETTFYNAAPTSLGFVTKGRNKQKSLGMRFAIVIDNPDPVAGCPKLIGPLSDTVNLILQPIHVSGVGFKNTLSYSKTSRSYKI